MQLDEQLPAMPSRFHTGRSGATCAMRLLSEDGPASLFKMEQSASGDDRVDAGPTFCRGAAKDSSRLKLFRR